MFGFFGNRRRRAGQVNDALRELRVWSKPSWLDHWHASEMTDLQAELDQFLPLAMEHAQTNTHLQDAYSAMITRFILLGITDSGTHENTELESALGVPMPTEAAP